jgi:hypothetical protein
MEKHPRNDPLGRLNYLLYRGPGVGLPLATDKSFGAAVIREVYGLAESSFMKARGLHAQMHTTVAIVDKQIETLGSRIAASDLPWPYKADLNALLSAVNELHYGVRARAA